MLSQLPTVKSRLAIPDLNVEFDDLLTTALTVLSAPRYSTSAATNLTLCSSREAYKVMSTCSQSPRPIGVKFATIVTAAEAARLSVMMGIQGFEVARSLEIACVITAAWLIFAGNHWVRWFFLCYFALELTAEAVLFPAAFVSPKILERLSEKWGLVPTIIGYTAATLQLVAIAGLFSKASRSWFKTRRALA
jgi:hypothetical protein